MIRTEITGAEIAEEMEKERRLFQLQMCEVRNKFLLLIMIPQFKSTLWALLKGGEIYFVV